MSGPKTGNTFRTIGADGDGQTALGRSSNRLIQAAASNYFALPQVTFTAAHASPAVGGWVDWGIGGSWGYLTQVEAVCVAYGDNGGTISIKIQSSTTPGTYYTLFSFVVAEPPPVGKRLTWNFDPPLKNAGLFNFKSTSANNDSKFYVQLSSATMGSWSLTCNGFYSHVGQLLEDNQYLAT